MADNAGDDRKALLAAAAERASGAAGVGDMRSYLRAYYRHVATEDLVAAGPERLAAVATEQAAFAAHRPQGRALVRVRRGGSASLAGARDAIDIVTDDMPFLVDSVRMELGRHEVALHLIVHPQLRVRRDVTGALREVLGLVDGDRPTHDEIAESWTHIEIAQLPDAVSDTLQQDLERVLGDVRVAVEDWPRMQAKAVHLAEQLSISRAGGAGGAGGGDGDGEPSAAGPDASEAPAEVEALLRWLADGHFTFLGYREYDLEDGAGRHGAARRGRHRPRHPAARPAGLERVRVAAARGARPGPRPAPADPDQGELPLDRAPAELPRLRRGQADGRGRGGRRRVPVPRPVHPRRLHREHHPDPGAAAQAGRGARGLRHRRGQPRRQGPRRVPGGLPARGAVPDPGGRSWSRWPRACSGCASAPRPGCSCARTSYGRYMSCLVYLPRDRYTTQVRLRTQEILREALHGAACDYSVMVGESPVARLHIVVRAGRGRCCPTWTGRAGEADRRRGPVLGRRPGRRGGPPARRGPGPGAARHGQRRRDPADLQDRRARQRRRRRPAADRSSCASPARTSSSTCGSPPGTSAACRSRRIRPRPARPWRGRGGGRGAAAGVAAERSTAPAPRSR